MSNLPRKIIHFAVAKRTQKWMISIGIFSFFLYLLLITPEFYVKNFIDHKQIKNSINSFIEKQPLTIFYNGVSISFYDGISLVDVKILHIQDDGTQIQFLQAEKLIVDFSWVDLIYNKKFNFTNLKIVQANIFWKMDGTEVSNSILEQLISIKNNNNFNLEIEQSKLHIDYIGDVYENKAYDINNFNLYIKMEDNIFRFQSDYKDPILGSGSLEYRPVIITKEIKSKSKNNKIELTTKKYLVGDYIWNMQQFPLTSLLWNNKEYYFKSGFINGSIVVHIEDIIKNLSFCKIQTDIILSNYELAYLGNPYFKNEKLELKGIYKTQEQGYEMSFYGMLNKVKFKVQINHNLSDIFPELASIELTPTDTGSNINLPYNIDIGGLDKLLCSTTKTNNTYEYRDILCDIKINQGYIQLETNKKINVPYLRFNIRDNKFTLKGDLEQNNNDLVVDIGGKIRLLKQTFTKIVQVAEVKDTSAIPSDIIVFQTNLEGTAKSKKITWENISYYYYYFKDKWQKRVEYDLNMSWHGLSLWNYPFFVTYLSNTNNDFRYQVDNFYYTKDISVPLQISLNSNPQGIKANISFQNTTQDYINTTWNYNGGSSHLEILTQLNLKEAYSFTKDWLPTNFPVSNFNTISLESRLTQSGARISDQYLSKTYSGKIRLEQVLLNESTLKLDTNPNFDTIEGSFSFSMGKGKSTNIIALNQNQTLQGTLDWSETLFNLNWFLNYTLK